MLRLRFFSYKKGFITHYINPLEENVIILRYKIGFNTTRHRFNIYVSSLLMY